MNKLPVADTFFRYSPIPGQYKKAGRRGQTNFSREINTTITHSHFMNPLFGQCIRQLQVLHTKISTVHQNLVLV